MIKGGEGVLYIYRELADRVNEVAYYGMPKNIDYDGIINGTTDLCELQPKLGVKPISNCVPMEKTFFLQYQWMAFFVSSLAILYYLPYIMYCKVNDDLIRLKKNLKIDRTPTETILRNYFKKDSNSRLHAKLRLVLNVLVKVLYVCANFISFLALDNVLYGEYIAYGKKWIGWSRLHNTLMYDYMGMREFPKPGNKLLPPFGYCEFYESARDIKQTKANKFKIVCELSQHILYQYCLLVLWFCFVIGMGVSMLGFLHLLWTYLSNLMLIRCDGTFRGITLRQMDYILYIKTRDKNLYGDTMMKLKEHGALNGHSNRREDGKRKCCSNNNCCTFPVPMVYSCCCKKDNHSDSD